MRRFILFLILFSFIFRLMNANFEQKIFSNATIEDSFHESRVLVVLDKNISGFNKIHDEKLFGSFEKLSIQDIFPVYNEEVKDAIIESIGEGEFRQIFQINLPTVDKQEVINAIVALEKIEGILYAGPDYEVQPALNPNDPLYTDNSLWGLNGTHGINAPQAWNVTTGSRNVRVGIIDTGVSSTHPDFYDEDGLGTNLAQGWRFYNPYPNLAPLQNPVAVFDDLEGHGTKVAGVVGSVGNNAEGISGVNWNVTIDPLGIFFVDDNSLVWESSSIYAIQYATNKWNQSDRMSILNYSYDGYGSLLAVLYAVNNFPGLFVWAAGNYSNYWPPDAPRPPANVSDVDSFSNISLFNLGNLISVAATESGGGRASFSRYSSSGEHINIYAPGDQILSTNRLNGYSYDNGTSFAAPYVTGVAALLLSINPALTAHQLKNIILDNSDDIEITLPYPHNRLQPVKKLDAYKAVTNQVNMINHQISLYSDLYQNIIADRYNWVCFPILNKYNKLDKQYHNGVFYDFYADDIFYNLHILNNNGLFQSNPNIEVLEILKWQYNKDIGYATISNANDIEHKLDSRYGYKIKLKYPYNISIDLDGFLAGTLGNPETKITLNAKEPQDRFRETWVGYFKARSMDPLTTLQDIEQYLIEIKTQYWALNRSSVNDPWPLIATNRRINFGEAVSLKYVGDIDRTFSWNNSRYRFPLDDETNQYIHPLPIYFSYVERDDYIPVYVDFCDVNIGDNLGEIALYIDDICYGAEVIIGEEQIQINAYIDDIDLETVNIELRIHEYDTSRDISEEIKPKELRRLQVRNITSDPNKTFYTISFKDETSGVVSAPLRSSLQGNYPNPFNPETTIRYQLAQNENVKLQIFNIKGQLVRSLVNASQNAGFYTVLWNGTDVNGSSCSSGIYFYRLETNTAKQVKRMLLLK